MRSIPIASPFIGEEEKQAVLAVLDSVMLVQGPQVAAFESEFAAQIGVKHAIATSSGTTALHLALLAHGIGPGDEVITTAFTFAASVNSILYTYAKPVFADIDATTFNLDPARIESGVTPRTRAIIPVHLYGQPCDMDAIGAIARKHGLAIIEDAAQAIGATFRGRPVATFGTACFSLCATKNVMRGEGGMITTDREEVAVRARLLRQHGMRERYSSFCAAGSTRAASLASRCTGASRWYSSCRLFWLPRAVSRRSGRAPAGAGAARVGALMRAGVDGRQMIPLQLRNRIGPRMPRLAWSGWDLWVWRLLLSSLALPLT